MKHPIGNVCVSLYFMLNIFRFCFFFMVDWLVLKHLKLIYSLSIIFIIVQSTYYVSVFSRLFFCYSFFSGRLFHRDSILLRFCYNGRYFFACLCF